MIEIASKKIISCINLFYTGLDLKELQTKFTYYELITFLIVVKLMLPVWFKIFLGQMYEVTAAKQKQSG